MRCRRAGWEQDERAEWAKCALSLPYWLDAYGRIYDPAARGWLPFRLWPAQMALAGQLQAGRQFVILKARQMGLTWLCAGCALWLMLFRPAATALLFSRRDDEAVHLLKFRLRGMYDRLPAWMQAARLDVDNDHELRLSNGSAALAFPTTGGRSYTASFALVDEADHVPELDRLLDAVKPTVDAGGRLILLSTADKGRPGSPFKRVYEAARVGENDYTPVFLPWSARPDRTAGVVRRDPPRFRGARRLHRQPVRRVSRERCGGAGGPHAGSALRGGVAGAVRRDWRASPPRHEGHQGHQERESGNKETSRQGSNGG